LVKEKTDGISVIGTAEEEDMSGGIPEVEAVRTAEDDEPETPATIL